MLVEIDTVVELCPTNQYKPARLGNPKAVAHVVVRPSVLKQYNNK